eukprot:UN4806
MYESPGTSCIMAKMLYAIFMQSCIMQDYTSAHRTHFPKSYGFHHLFYHSCCTVLSHSDMKGTTLRNAFHCIVRSMYVKHGHASRHGTSAAVMLAMGRKP